jgi:hypothetical protein
MALVGKRITVDTTVGGTLITRGQGDTGALGTSDFSATIKNTHATATVYLGGSGVTTATGYPLAAGDVIDLGDLGTDDAVYGIVTTSTAVVAVLEVA